MNEEQINMTSNEEYIQPNIDLSNEQPVQSDNPTQSNGNMPTDIQEFINSLNQKIYEGSGVYEEAKKYETEELEALEEPEEEVDSDSEGIEDYNTYDNNIESENADESILIDDSDSETSVEEINNLF